MTTHTPLLARPSSARPSDPDRIDAPAPVLIQVPTVTARARARRVARPSTVYRGRRRIRREVRVAASTMLFALPMSWALMMFARVGPEPAAPMSAVAAGTTVAVAPEPIAEDGPRVTISLQPSVAASAPSTEADAPLAAPAGYLVPDDGSEETAHAGN